jgi:hypothetical protein
MHEEKLLLNPSQQKYRREHEIVAVLSGYDRKPPRASHLHTRELSAVLLAPAKLFDE